MTFVHCLCSYCLCSHCCDHIVCLHCGFVYRNLTNRWCHRVRPINCHVCIYTRRRVALYILVLIYFFWLKYVMSQHFTLYHGTFLQSWHDVYLFVLIGVLMVVHKWLISIKLYHFLQRIHDVYVRVWICLFMKVH